MTAEIDERPDPESRFEAPQSSRRGMIASIKRPVDDGGEIRPEQPKNGMIDEYTVDPGTQAVPARRHRTVKHGVLLLKRNFPCPRKAMPSIEISTVSC